MRIRYRLRRPTGHPAEQSLRSHHTEPPQRKVSDEYERGACSRAWRAVFPDYAEKKT